MPVMGRAATKEAKPDRSGATQAALSVVERYGGRRGAQFATLAATAQIAAPAIEWTWKRMRREKDFTITITGDDGVYADVHEWVLERIPESERRALLLATSVGKVAEEGVDSVRLFYDGSTTQDVRIEGHKLTVRVERENLGGAVSPAERGRYLLEKVVFTASSAAGRDALIKMIDGLVTAKRGDTRPPLMVPSRWGGQWNRRGDLPERTLNSVILKDGQLERLVDDLGAFLASEEQYIHDCQPWHRGYLLSGIPGSGKTSVARSLANHFDMSIYYLPLGDLDADADLMTLVTQVEPRSMLLLEDVDVYHAATERTAAKGRTSLASLLNALDGIWTPHGLVTVLTTNNKGALDDALIRKGRIDVDEEFTALDEPQGRRILEWFERDTAAAALYEGESPAVLTEDARNGKPLRTETHAHVEEDRGRGIGGLGTGDSRPARPAGCESPLVSPPPVVGDIDWESMFLEQVARW